MHLYVLSAWKFLKFCCFILYKQRGSTVSIVQYKTVLNILDKKHPFCNHKKSLRVWLSYLTVTNPWNVSLFLGCTYAKAELIQKKWLVRLLQHVAKPWVKTIFPDLSGNIMQQYNNNKKKSICVSRAVHVVRTWALLYDAWTLYIIPERTPPSSPWCLSMHSLPSHLTVLSKHFSIWEMENKRCLSGVKSLLLVDVLMPDDLVGNPVEDVEDEESQRKGGPGDSVYPLGSVHKLLPHGVYVLGDWWLRVWSWSSVLNSWAILCWQTLTHIVASEIKAAFTHIIILKKHMRMWTEWTFQKTAAQTVCFTS